MIGLVVGFISGGIQFWLLSMFTRRVTGAGPKAAAALLGLAQFLLPLPTLLAVAFFRKADLLPAAAGITAALGLGAASKLTAGLRRKRGGVH